MRFDQVELETVPLVGDEVPAKPSHAAPWLRRLLALLTDLSLFAALALALLPLLSEPGAWLPRLSLAGFVTVFSYYYFVGSWILWGKTVGGAIFDVRVASNQPGAISVRAASLRWAGLCLSLLTAGLAFLFRLPDRLSDTHSA